MEDGSAGHRGAARERLGVPFEYRGDLLMPKVPRRGLLGAGLLVLTTFCHPLASPAVAAGQAELDRIVARVNNRIITTSDVRQARLLQLVDDTSSDDTTRRALEDRILILGDMTR